MRIEDYALIGDLQTAALVGNNGSIDWLCFPRFDSGACFAALLGDESNGRWLIAPAGEVKRTSRRYRVDTLVLDTEFETDSGSVRIVDFMPPRGKAPDVVRIVEGMSGTVRMQMELVIRFDYGSIVPWVRRRGNALTAIGGPDALVLRTPVPTKGKDLRTVAEFEVGAGDWVPFTLTWHPSSERLPRPIDPAVALARDGRLLGRMDGGLHLRRRVAERGDDVTDGAEGAHLRAHRRHRGRPDHLPAGAARRRAQLGLPLLLAP